MSANRSHRRPITRPVFHHTTFTTNRLDEMVDFYEMIAGLEPVFHGDEGAWLTNDEANHRIALLAMPDMKDPVDKGHTTGLHHTAFEYPNFDIWLDNFQRMKNHGIVPFVCLDHGMTMSMYYIDPDGNAVEIQFDTFGAWQDSKEWMWASQEFGNNPIGEFFDPDQIVAEREAGLSGDEIHQNARKGKYRPDEVPEIYLPELW